MAAEARGARLKSGKLHRHVTLSDRVVTKLGADAPLFRPSDGRPVQAHGRAALLVDTTVLDENSRRLRPSLHLEFFEYADEVVLYRVLAETELRARLLVGQAFGH